MLTTGAYSSLQNYGFIITFPSKSENINSCYISGFKSLFSTDLSLSARRAVTKLTFHSPFSCFPTLKKIIYDTVYYKLMMLFGNQK